MDNANPPAVSKTKLKALLSSGWEVVEVGVRQNWNDQFVVLRNGSEIMVICPQILEQPLLLKPAGA